MAFVQKDKNSRKDKLAPRAGGAAPESAVEVNPRPRAVVRRRPNGEQSLSIIWPAETGRSMGHLDEVLQRLRAEEAEESTEELAPTR